MPAELYLLLLGSQYNAQKTGHMKPLLLRALAVPSSLLNTVFTQ